MKKYFLTDGTLQQGPFDIEELRSKNITSETPVWYEGLGEWTTAGKLDELKGIFSNVPSAVIPVEEIKPIAPTPVVVTAVPVAAAAAATTASTTAKTATAVIAAKKSTAWISWAALVIILGGAGYFIYQDMEKNKSSSGGGVVQTGAGGGSTGTTNLADTSSSTAQISSTEIDTAGTAGDVTTTTETDPTTTTTNTEPATVNKNNTDQTAAQKLATQKAADEKKKQIALKKAADDKKKADAAKAAVLAKEMEQRNHWAKYISFGKLNYETKGDDIKPFDVPVYNGTDAVLDKVTVKIEYWKKDKKIVKTEMITLYNVPARGGLNGKAPESKKGDKVNVYITSVTSKKLHFCYPGNSGNPADPFYCN